MVNEEKPFQNVTLQSLFLQYIKADPGLVMLLTFTIILTAVSELTFVYFFPKVAISLFSSDELGTNTSSYFIYASLVAVFVGFIARLSFSKLIYVVKYRVERVLFRWIMDTTRSLEENNGFCETFVVNDMAQIGTGVITIFRLFLFSIVAFLMTLFILKVGDLYVILSITIFAFALVFINKFLKTRIQKASYANSHHSKDRVFLMQFIGKRRENEENSEVQNAKDITLGVTQKINNNTFILEAAPHINKFIVEFSLIGMLALIVLASLQNSESLAPMLSIGFAVFRVTPYSLGALNYWNTISAASSIMKRYIDDLKKLPKLKILNFNCRKEVSGLRLDGDGSYSSMLFNIVSSLKLKYGASYQITGESGAGKTTFFKILLNTVKKSEAISASKIYYLTQSTNLENISRDLFYQIFELEQGEFVEIKNRLNIQSSLADEGNITLMSGGEKQRLMHAGLFQSEYQIIFLDETLNNLDNANANYLLKLIKEYNEKAIIIYIDHGKRHFADHLIQIEKNNDKHSITFI